MGVYIGITLSICCPYLVLFVRPIVSVQYLLNHSTMNFFLLLFFTKLLVHLQPNLVFIVQHHKQECPVENGIITVKVRAKVQPVSECLSGGYLLNIL